MTTRNAATLALLLGILAALGAVLFAKFAPSHTTAQVRNTDTATLVVVLTPPGQPPTRCTLQPGELCSAPFVRGMTLSVWIGPADVADPATWRVDGIGGVIDARSTEGAMEIAGPGLQVTPLTP